MRAMTEAPATHYRLSPETWAEIVEEYLDGATAKEVAAKWKTSAGSVYRWTKELKPGGKRGNGEARARAHARLVAEEEEALGSGRSVGSRALKGLFAPARADDPDAADPVALAQAATLASGRAMKGRLWAEAKALAALAESYARLAVQPALADDHYRPSPQDQAALAFVLDNIQRREAAEAAEAAGEWASVAEDVDAEGAAGW